MPIWVTLIEETIIINIIITTIIIIMIIIIILCMMFAGKVQVLEMRLRSVMIREEEGDVKPLFLNLEQIAVP